MKDQVYPLVIKSDGVYIMLYGCYWNDDNRTALGYAVSNDSHAWTKHADNPVFRPEPKHDWESIFTTSHALMQLPEGSFRVWYVGRKQPPSSSFYFAIGTAKWNGLGLAESISIYRITDRELYRVASQHVPDSPIVLRTSHRRCSCCRS